MRHLFKKGLAVLLAAVLSFGVLTSCGTDQTSGETSQTSASQQGGEAEIPLPPEGGQQLTVSPPLIKGDRSVTEAGIGALAQHLKRTPGFCGRTYAVALEGMVEGGGRPIVQHPDGQEHQNDQTKAQFFLHKDPSRSSRRAGLPRMYPAVSSRSCWLRMTWS